MIAAISLIYFSCHDFFRFSQGVELIIVCSLQISGRINTTLLSPNTTYSAYIIFQLAKRAYGLGIMPIEIEVEVGKYRTQETLCVNEDHCSNKGLQREGESNVVARNDGCLEVELGEFYNDINEDEIKMEFKEIKGAHLKTGLVIEGIELRPKH